MVDKRGFVLLTTLVIVDFLTVAGVSLFMPTLWRTLTSYRIYDRSNALELAEAGVDQAALNLRTTSTSDDMMTATLSSGTFTIDEESPLLGGQLYKVTARGISRQEQRRIEAIVKRTPQSTFQFALFGDHDIKVSGSAITDSYTSSLGPYNNNPNSPSYNAGHKGDVGTNATTAGGVTVGGSIFIDGQVAVGPNVSNPTSVVTGYNPAFITGGTSPPSDTQDAVSQATTFPTPAVTVPVGLTCSDYTVAGNTNVPLSPGTYCYHNLTIQGGGTLTANGPVTVYLTGQFTARGNSVMGVPSSPKQMVVLMASGSDATLEQGTITGSTEFYGALYGPDATINISGNAKIFGSIVAKEVNVTGSAEIHYDTSLTDVTQVSNLFTVSRVAWREL